MKATDGDKDRQESIVYFLTGQGIDPDRPDQSKFDINKTSGELYVLKVYFFYIYFQIIGYAMTSDSLTVTGKNLLFSHFCMSLEFLYN